MIDQNLVLYREDAEIAVVTLNRPKALNALDVPTLKRLSALLDQISAAEYVKAVIITGSGTAFSAGADIRYLVWDNSTALAKRSASFRIRD